MKYTDVYIEFKNENIYIEQYFTGEGITDELIRLDIIKSDIIFVFKAPEVRKFTEFAMS
ncbi:MAG: XisI protein [Okeania sp. SIO2G4]|uniref:element excision factor XisI family protein n=1 Tax=unclassified Okeania TaxID=2634635 RepID=UPI0013B681C6|nr:MULTISPECIES: element excision factor XisI family protein [unclassified Okeania]NEP04586.1 XisI protein [Okeania sp. SIO4D6]NEP41467.1 XisI protein [Okeania sp. SIO2H7]NEP72370.1 XisI protein [Okeania sp. SIO2G5]NEP93209.1 XisI protein [Okeania sp. SIO2F5]NEQ91220.1 XisI protein [Okeania sp. SIO2G4]